MSDTNQNSWTNGKSENYEDGWYQDEYGEGLNEFDWHQDENGEWYYEDSYDYEADGWKQVGGKLLSTRASLTLLHLGFVSRSSFFLVFERDRAFFSPINSCLRIEFKFRGKIFCPFLFPRPPA